MTLLELSTDLSGRYVSFRINPLSFKEIVELTNTKEKDYEKLLFDVFKWSGLPQRFLFENTRISEFSAFDDIEAEEKYSQKIEELINQINKKDK